MPLPLIPIVLGAASLAAGAMGIKKGVDAKKLYERGREIGEGAERKHRRALEELEQKREHVFEALRALGEKKREVFERTARVVVDAVKQARASAHLTDFELGALPAEELAAFEHDIAEMSSIDVAADSAKGAALAALGARGIFGSVAGPALAIAGFALASKAEKAVTNAEEYAAEVNEKIAALKPIHVMLDGIAENAAEMGMVLDRIHAEFETARQGYDELAKSTLARQQHAAVLDKALQRMILVFKTLKEIVQQPLLDEQQMPLVGFKEQLARTLQVADIALPPPQKEQASS